MMTNSSLPTPDEGSDVGEKPLPDHRGFAGAGRVLRKAIVTLLHIAPLIPVGKWGFIPDQLPRFSYVECRRHETREDASLRCSLPLPKRGVRQNSYNGGRYGAGLLSGWGVVWWGIAELMVAVEVALERTKREIGSETCPVNNDIGNCLCTLEREV